jgi:DNA-directed RNA polymerase specialized sigma24 family protein
MAGLNPAIIETTALARVGASLRRADEPSWSRCRTTRWSVVVAAAAGGEAARVALGRLYRVYWRPVFAVIAKRRGYDAAVELTQAFFVARWVESNDLQRVASRPGGRFRGWLFSALRCFLSNQLQFEHRKCRDARRNVALESDPGDAPSRAPILVLADPALDPERQLRRKEVLSLLSRVLQRLRHEYCTNAAAAGVNAEQRFEAVKDLLPGESSEIARSRDIAASLGLSPGALTQLVRRLRVRFCQLLLHEARRAFGCDVDMATAKRLLCEALSESATHFAEGTVCRRSTSCAEA